MTFSGPEPLSNEHAVSDFHSGEPSLDNWLTQRAKKSQSGDTARTFVCLNDERVVGFVSLASGSVRRDDAPRPLARNAPDPIPVAKLARLAVDTEMQGHGLGSLLLVHALERAVAAGVHVAIKAVIVNPISERAAAFYAQNGFRPLPHDNTTQFLTMSEIVKTLAKPS